MKRTIKVWAILSMLTLISFSVNAQVGVEAGILSSPYKSSVDGENSDETYGGFRLGVTYNFGLAMGLSINTGLHYSYLGKSEDNYYQQSGVEVKEKVGHKEHYLDVPIRLAYTYPVANSVKIFAYAGPKLVMGLSSKMKEEVTVTADNQSISASVTYNMYNGKVDVSVPKGMEDLLEDVPEEIDMKLSRFDVQVGFGLGIILFDRVTIKEGYDWGLLNKMTGDAADDMTLKRNQFYLGVGYTF